MKKSIFTLINLLFFSVLIFSQDNKFNRVAIGFYNVENLYDTLDTDDVSDFEFTPEGPNNWNSPKYFQKLDRLGEVISMIATEGTPDGAAIIGLCEVENSLVLKDVVNSSRLAPRGYQFVHIDGPDRRGVDAALLYNPKYFQVTNSKSYTLKNPNDDNFRTRDQLVVSGKLLGDPIHVIVCHWPSRRGGEKRSAPLRNLAGQLARSIVDSIHRLEGPNAKIIVMGDLNDDPVNKSVTQHLGATGDMSKVNEKTMFNPFYDLYKNGIGSLAWQDVWNLFDQIIVSPDLANKNQDGWHFTKAKVFNKPMLQQPDGRFKGYPWRSYAGGQYQGGYSDHFPTYIFLERKVK